MKQLKNKLFRIIELHLSQYNELFIYFRQSSLSIDISRTKVVEY